MSGELSAAEAREMELLEQQLRQDAEQVAALEARLAQLEQDEAPGPAPAPAPAPAASKPRRAKKPVTADSPVIQQASRLAKRSPMPRSERFKSSSAGAAGPRPLPRSGSSGSPGPGAYGAAGGAALGGEVQVPAQAAHLVNSSPRAQRGRRTKPQSHAAKQAELLEQQSRQRTQDQIKALRRESAASTRMVASLKNDLAKLQNQSRTEIERLTIDLARKSDELGVMRQRQGKVTEAMGTLALQLMELETVMQSHFPLFAANAAHEAYTDIQERLHAISSNVGQFANQRRQSMAVSAARHRGSMRPTSQVLSQPVLASVSEEEAHADIEAAARADAFSAADVGDFVSRCRLGQPIDSAHQAPQAQLRPSPAAAPAPASPPPAPAAAAATANETPQRRMSYRPAAWSAEKHSLRDAAAILEDVVDNSSAHSSVLQQHRQQSAAKLAAATPAIAWTNLRREDLQRVARECYEAVCDGQDMNQARWFKFVNRAHIPDERCTYEQLERVFADALTAASRNSKKFTKRIRFDDCFAALSEVAALKYPTAESEARRMGKLFTEHISELHRVLTSGESVESRFADIVVQPEVIRFVQAQQEGLKKLFRRFSGMGAGAVSAAASASSLGGLRKAPRYLHAPEFLRFVEDFEIVPNLASEEEVLRVFRELAGIKGQLTFPQFVELMGVLALNLYDEGYEAECPTPVSKIQRFFLEIDSSGAVFSLEAMPGGGAATAGGARGRSVRRAQEMSRVTSSFMQGSS